MNFEFSFQAHPLIWIYDFTV